MTESIFGLVVDPETYCQFVSAIEKLGEDLSIALALYDVPETRRLGAIGALSGVTNFITECKDFEAARLHVPLLDLQMALSDAEKGVSDPILEKAKSTVGRPRASSQRQMLRPRNRALGGRTALSCRSTPQTAMKRCRPPWKPIRSPWR